MWRQNDETQTMLAQSAEAYLASAHSLARFREGRKSQYGYDMVVWTAMAELGWAGILLPEDAGGAGLDLPPALTLAEIFGRHLVPEPFVASAIIAGHVLAEASSPTARQLACSLASGEMVVLLADQEKAGMVSPERPDTTIIQVGARSILRGRKSFIPNWRPDAHLLVTAMQGNELCVVELAGNRVEATSQRMSDGTLSAEVVLDDIEINEDQILLRGAAAAGAVRVATAYGIIALSAQLEGLAAALHRMTSDYVLQRHQFGHPLAHFQSVRHMLANLHIEIELSGAAWRAAALEIGNGYSGRATAGISAAKARCSETALAVAKAAIQLHGAFGYADEADVGLYVNAALRWASWLGNAQYHRRNALSLHRQAYND